MENLAVKFANNGDIDELQHGLDKLHNQPKQPGKQKHKESEKVDRSNVERTTETNYATVSKNIQFNANLAQLSKECSMCGKNVIHLNGQCDVYMHAGVTLSALNMNSSVVKKNLWPTI